MGFVGQDIVNFFSYALQTCGGSGDLVAVVGLTSDQPDYTPSAWSESFCFVAKGYEATCGTNNGVHQY